MTEAEYLRELALDYEIKTKCNPDDLKKIRADLGKIGSNVNQIARAVNQGKFFDEARFKRMSYWLVQTLEKL